LLPRSRGGSRAALHARTPGRWRAERRRPRRATASWSAVGRTAFFRVLTSTATPRVLQRCAVGRGCDPLRRAGRRPCPAESLPAAVLHVLAEEISTAAGTVATSTRAVELRIVPEPFERASRAGRWRRRNRPVDRCGTGGVHCNWSGGRRSGLLCRDRAGLLCRSHPGFAL